MPLQKKKKKKPKATTDKSVKQVVTQIVKVNVGDTKPKRKRKRKSGGSAQSAAAAAPMQTAVPQQFIYPPPFYSQEARMEPLRPPQLPSMEVPNPYPVSALNRVLGSVPKSTLPVQQEVQQPPLLSNPVAQRYSASLRFPSTPPQSMSPPPSPSPSLTSVDIAPIGARELKRSYSAPTSSAVTDVPDYAALVRSVAPDTLVTPSAFAPVVAPPAENVVGLNKPAKDESALALRREKQRQAAARSRARQRGDPNAPPLEKVGRKKLVQVGEFEGSSV